MLRTLGYTKSKLTQLLCYQTLIYSIPGTALGLVVMVLGLTGLHMMIYEASHYSMYTEIGYYAIIIVNLIKS